MILTIGKLILFIIFLLLIINSILYRFKYKISPIKNDKDGFYHFITFMGDIIISLIIMISILLLIVYSWDIPIK